MKLYVLPPSPRAFKVIALKNHLGLDCETQIVDLGKGDQLTPEYVAMNPKRKMPVLEHNGFVLWESNAILFYLASRARSALWPQDARCQADVLRWLAWESTHWDAESVGMVGYEKVSRGVLGLGHGPGLDRAGRAELRAICGRAEPVSQGGANGLRAMISRSRTSRSARGFRSPSG